MINLSVPDYVSFYESTVFAISRTIYVASIACFVVALVLPISVLWYQKADIPEINWQIGPLGIHVWKPHFMRVIRASHRDVFTDI